MKKTITLTYPAGPERVAAMLADPDYQRKRVERADLSDASIDVAVRGRGFVSTISGSVPPERLPSAAKEHEMPIIAARAFDTDEGQKITLWLRVRPEQIKFEVSYGDDETQD